MATMVAPSCPVISCHLGASFGVSAGASRIQMKIWKPRDGSDSACKRVECACVHVLNVVCRCHRHRVQLQSWNRRSISNPSIILGLKVFPRLRAAKKVVFETVPEEASPKEPANAPSSWISLPALGLALSAALVGQPVYAAGAVLPELGVQMAVTNDSASSVEAIFAKQLAHRFRDMSDEELVEILQQLLQASRSSPGTQNSVVRSVPEDLVIQKDESRIETKAGERIREEVRASATKDTNTSPGKEVKDSNTLPQTQSGDFQGPIDTRESMRDKVPLPQAKRMTEKEDERKKKKFYDKSNGKQPQGQDMPVVKENAEVQSDEQFADTQETLTRNKSATAPSSAENNAGDASLKTTGPTSAAELSSSKASDNGTGVGEDEDATELLWAEWSRRASGQARQEPQTSNTSFDFPGFGQDIIAKVAAFTELQKAVGIFIVWSILMALAFYLGRSRASARKYVVKSIEAPIKYQWNLSPVSSDGSARRDLKPLSATLSRVSEIFQNYGDALKEFMTKGNRVSDASSRGKNYDADMSPVEGEANNTDDQPEIAKRWRTPLIQSLLSATPATQETSARKSQGSFDQSPPDSMPGSSGQDLNDLSNPPRNGTRSESTNDTKHSSAMSKNVVVDWSEGVNLDHGRDTSPTGDRYSAETTGTGSNLRSQKNSPKHMPIERQQQVDDHWGQLSSKRFVRDDDSNEQAGQGDGLEGAHAEHKVGRETEGSPVSQSEANLDSFAHDHTLWIRDGDGIFIRKAAGREEGEATMATISSTYEHDMPELTPSFDSIRKGNHISAVGPTKPSTGFDYRQVVIESTGVLPRKDQNGLAMESEPPALKNKVWPLRYRSGRQKVS